MKTTQPRPVTNHHHRGRHHRPGPRRSARSTSRRSLVADESTGGPTALPGGVASSDNGLRARGSVLVVPVGQDVAGAVSDGSRSDRTARRRDRQRGRVLRPLREGAGSARRRCRGHLMARRFEARGRPRPDRRRRRRTAARGRTLGRSGHHELLSGDLPDGRGRDADHQSALHAHHRAFVDRPGSGCRGSRIWGSRIAGAPSVWAGSCARRTWSSSTTSWVSPAFTSGPRGVYRIAQREGDTELALLASVVLGEVAPQRMMTATKISAVDLAPYLRREPSGTFRLDMPDSHLDTIMEMAEGLTERRFFGEVILTGNVIAHLGTPDQQGRVRESSSRTRGRRTTPSSPTSPAGHSTTRPPTSDLAEFYPHPMER